MTGLFKKRAAFAAALLLALISGSTPSWAPPVGAGGSSGVGGSPGSVPPPTGLVVGDWKGDWLNSTLYSENDRVYYNGSSYYAKEDNQNHLPTDATYWGVIAIKGDTGATGATGAQGATILSGTSVPSNGSGNNGDIYLRTTTRDVYTKSGGVWSLSFNIQGTISDQRLLGNVSGGTAAPTELGPSTVRTLLGLATVATSASAADLSTGTLPAARLGGITLSTSSGTFTLANSKTFTVSNTLTLAGTDSATLTFQGTDTYVGRTTTDTLTNKTLTSPTITGGTHAGGTHTALTALGIRSTGSGAFDLTLANTENLTAGRTLTLKLNDAARTIDLGGALTTAGAFTTSGANALTLTTTGTTGVTLPTTGTLATLAGSETLTNKTLTAPIISSISNTGTLTLPTSTDTLVGRATTDTLTNKTYDTAGTGNAFKVNGTTVTTASDILDRFCSTRGSIITRQASGWACLTPGTSGDLLQTGGAGADPSWATAGASLSAATDAQTRAQTATTVALTPANLAGRATFAAHKNGTDQTGIASATPTKVTFGTEVFDVGSAFATSTWTPPAGKVRLSAGLNIGGTLTVGGVNAIVIYKNGAVFRQANYIAATASSFSMGITATDSANGTDTYEIYVYGTVSSGSVTVDGHTYYSWFEGEQI